MNCLGTINDEGQLLEFAELGSYLEFDMFGVEVSHYQLNEEIDMPSDAQRIQRIWQLVDEGYEKNILVSHDIYARHRLVLYLFVLQELNILRIDIVKRTFCPYRGNMEGMDMGTSCRMCYPKCLIEDSLSQSFIPSSQGIQGSY